VDAKEMNHFSPCTEIKLIFGPVFLAEGGDYEIVITNDDGFAVSKTTFTIK
jgi:hypothetical protein